MSLPKKIIDLAYTCDCIVCRTLVGSSLYNSDVTVVPDKWERQRGSRNYELIDKKLGRSISKEATQ